ncbi:hypothetical protein H072_6689 [Dactylellina haptotyla CBS 200.50]|uniref:Uncharacterized protein n=1 Tax=Dactylellina haptotyla (strain CBS 200.50) TaxID=1284197 RepID=S8A9J1_DACHA|nr:hypothetical protein H072_6689 [Dactylellina haptotyla CBS 200.50]
MADNQYLSKSESKAATEGHIQTSPAGGSAEPKAGGIRNLFNRLGVLSTFLFFGSSAFAIICMGWFGFLWWGTAENSTWHSIVINDWAVRAISLPSSLFRIAIAVQTGTCLSMLAALALEKTYVPLPDLAAISTMRATSPSLTDTLLKFIYPLIAEFRNLGVLSIICLALFITFTSSLLGFSSTILLSDVVVQPIPSYNTRVTTPIDFKWDLGATPVYGFPQNFGGIVKYYYWQTNQQRAFAPFAEYSEPPQVVPGLVDTGFSIRAFPPFIESQDRVKLNQFSGKAVVWDSRVVCQKPQVSNAKFTNIGSAYRIDGTVQKTVDFDQIQESSPASTSFSCVVSADRTGISICQLSTSSSAYSGGLKSAFSKPENSIISGRAYMLLINPYDSTATKYLAEKQEWAQIGTVAGNSDKGTSGKVLASLCYAAMDAVDRDIEMFSSKLNQEPQFAILKPSILQSTSAGGDGTPTYTFSEEVMSRLIPGTKTIEARGLLKMTPPESGWAQDISNEVGSDGPWYKDSSNGGRIRWENFLVNALRLDSREIFEQSSGQQGGCTISFSDYFISSAPISQVDYLVTGKSWIGDLYRAIQDHADGNTAIALQGVFTAMASNAYYDFAPRFNRIEDENSLVTYFQNVSSPGGPYGTKRGGEWSSEQQGLLSGHFNGKVAVGYTIVAVFLGLQILVAFIILVRFMLETKVTRIGDPWQALAQVSSDYGDEISSIFALSRKTNTTRNAVAQELEDKHRERTRVGVEEVDGSVKLIHRGEDDHA